MSILINRFNLRYAMHQTNLSPDIADMLTDKIADLLERDKAMKIKISGKDYYPERHCPVCDWFICQQADAYPTFENGESFCERCGQRLDWSE